MTFRKLGRVTKTLNDFVSEDILKKFVKELPWMKDQIIGINNEYKDVCKIDTIGKSVIHLKDGDITGKVFLNLLLEYPKFTLGKHSYELNLSNFYRTGLKPKTHIDKFPMFHVRKIIDKVTV